MLYLDLQMVTHSNNSHLNRTWLSDAHICLVAAPSLSLPLSVCRSLCLAHLFCISLCALKRWPLEDLPRLSYALTDGLLMQSSHGADAGHEMKHSLYQLGMSTERESEGWGGRDGEKGRFSEDRGEGAEGYPDRGRYYHTWLTSHEPGQGSHLTMHVHICKHTHTHTHCCFRLVLCWNQSLSSALCHDNTMLLNS